MVYLKPSPSRPTRLAAGTRTLSNSMNVVFDAHQPCVFIRRVVMPGMPLSRTSRLALWWPEPEEVLHKTVKKSAFMPPVIHFFDPFTMKWSPCLTAVVLMALTSDPPLGSVTHKQALFSPVTQSRTMRRFKSSPPYTTTGGRPMFVGTKRPASNPPEPQRASSSHMTRSKKGSTFTASHEPCQSPSLPSGGVPPNSRGQVAP
mmetsp:Transcript_4083/g.11828  ORF Transcript_4083/g.11828 Transcript_4083/m.11828 type:complete len:202 (+) Transcript_4083:510-1115(+)